MAALIERISCMTFERDLFRSFVPGMAGLAAAMHQQHGRAGVAEHVGNEFVAGGADEGCSGGNRVSGHSVYTENLILIDLLKGSPNVSTSRSH